MKKSTRTKCIGAVILVAVLILAGSGTAMAFGHYTPGVEGINAATLPPPGLHYLMYNLFYNSDTLTDDNGDDIDVGLDLNVYANVHRFAYITNQKLLGADVGVGAIIPLLYTNIEIEALGVDEDTFGIGDILLEPLILGWHFPQLDVTAALGVFTPTGENDAPSDPGLGYWSIMETLGATYYFDSARTISASVLTRWLQNTEDDDTDITAGADMVAEYGVSKMIPLQETLLLFAGVTGYSYAQLAEDSGDTSSDEKFIGHAIGAEVRLLSLKPFPMQMSLRYSYEYGAENTTEGQSACLTLIGSF